MLLSIQGQKVVFISLFPLQFLSLIIYTFHCRDLSSLWLNSQVINCFVVAGNELVLLIFFSDYSLLVYNNTANFFVLILCPATLLNLLITSNIFWQNHWNFLNILMWFTNKDNWIYHSQIEDSFYQLLTQNLELQQIKHGFELRIDRKTIDLKKNMRTLQSIHENRCMCLNIFAKYCI